MLQALSRPQHALHSDFGSLPGIDAEEGKVVVRIFRREQACLVDEFSFELEQVSFSMLY